MEEIYTVRCCTYVVRTTVTARAAAVRKWIASAKYRGRHFYRRGRLVVGLGVQWVPNDVSAATLQLCVGRRCLIFQLDHANHCPLALRRFLVDRDVTLVGLGNYRDARMLLESRLRLKVGRLVDVKVVARDVRGCDRGASMGTLAAEILGMHGVEKDELVGRSAWDNERLSADQVTYACYDVFIAYLLATNLRVWSWGGDD